MNVSAWCIRNPIASIMFFVLLCLAGMLGYQNMKVQNFPDLDVPNITISASLPGASPAQLETEVARKLENAIAGIEGLKNIYTTVQDGAVNVTGEFRLEKLTQEALDEVRSAVQQVRGDLPSDVRDPIVSKLNLSGSPVLAYAIRSKLMDDEALSWFVDDALTRKLLAVKGVGQVSRVGGVNRQVRIALDTGKMQSLGVSAADVSRQLRMVQMDTAGGRAELGDSEQPVRTLATVKSAEELNALELSLPNGQKVRLDQIADVQDTIAEPRSTALLNGVSVVGFEVTRSKGSSEVEAGKGVRAVLAQLKVSHPDIELTEAFDFVTPVEEEYNASITLLIEGALLAVLVVWLFLRDWRATFVSAVALPLSVIPAFIGMNYFGFSINVVTLLALSLVIGILVDDAIVEVENIVRHLRMGKTPYQAAMEAADEIGMAVIATTFTLIAVFLPLAFMSGIVGKFFKQFGWTASLAVFASLVVARMLTPMMAAYILKPIVHHVEREGLVMRWYMRASRWCIRHRWITTFIAISFFAGSIFLIPLLPQGFIPADDNSQTQVYIELPPGSKLSDTTASAEQARALISKVQHVKSVYTTIGGGAAGSDPFAGGGSSESRKATLTILLDKRGERPRKQGIENNIRVALESLPGARYKVGLGGSGEKYILALTSEDPLALSTAAAAVEKDLRTIRGVGSIASSAALVRPEVTVRPDSARMADRGVTSASIGETLRIATVGDYDASLPKLNLSQRQVPIVVRLANDARNDLGSLERLMVPGSKGPVMLSQVADLSIEGGPAVITRFNRARNVQFEVELSGVPLGEMTTAVAELPSIKNLPANVKQVAVGDAEVSAEMFASFMLAILIGVLCIYIVLVLLFKNFIQPLTILVALILSVPGAFIALLITDRALSMPTLIGLIMLMGIATKNSILLVEYAIEARRGRPATETQPASPPMSRLEALLDACHKRARPIVMTTIAMGAGMLPIAMSWGSADGSFRSPMAIVVIGGLITSTFLSLLIIPAVFTLVDDGAELLGKLRRKIFGHSMAHTAPAMPHQEPAPIPVRAKTSPTEPLWK
jgi:multidrug efflux pump subunit AcrB